MSDRIDVAIRQGTLRGIVEKNVYDGQYIAFRGIPYARPPIGQLRFKDPLPPESWRGVRDATEFGNEAAQIDPFTRKIKGSEDCLYLNVYTTSVRPREKRAVMVWIHGGGFYCGSGNHDIYGPDYIVRNDVVLVTLNYRLTALGFLNLDHEMATGNQALKDTLMALRWVRENISNFGGDPGNVTIFGESAGGAMVHYLAMSPLADGLFHKAISQSGTAANPWAWNELQLIQAKSFLLAEKLGKRTTDPKIAGEFLMTVDVRKLLETSKELLTEEEERKNILPFVPSLDRKSPNPFFLEHPEVTFRRGVKVPFLIGFTDYEGGLFTCCVTDRLLKKIDSNFEITVHPKVLSTLKQLSIPIGDLRLLYFGNKPVSKKTIVNYSNYHGDMYFYRDIYKTADMQMRLGHRSTYIYNFAYESEVSFIKTALKHYPPGVVHCDELSYLFHARMRTNLGLKTPERDSEDYKIINYITHMWTDFAKTGDPTPAVTDSIPIKWSPLEKENVYNYLEIDRRLEMKTVRKEDLRCYWKNIQHKL